MTDFNDMMPLNNFTFYDQMYRQFPSGPPPFNFPFNGGDGPIPEENDGPPMGPPPSFTPSRPKNTSGINVKSVDPGSIKFCKRKYTYLWLTNGNSFWAYITYVGKQSISGFRWFRYRWVYFGIDLKRIDSFMCY